MIWTHCPGCSGDWERSTTLIPGYVVLRCPRCQAYGIEGDSLIGLKDEIGHVELRGWLENRARSLDAHSEEARTLAAMYGPDDDPRWEKL